MLEGLDIKTREEAVALIKFLLAEEKNHRLLAQHCEDLTYNMDLFLLKDSGMCLCLFFWR